MNVEQAGTAGVGGVGDMHASACKPPDQKAVDGAETQFASGGTLACALDAVKHPGQFRGGEIGIEKQPGFLGDHSFLAGVLHNRADVRGAPVLPDDGIVDRFAGGALPDDGSLALVGDPYGDRHDAPFAGTFNHGGGHLDCCLPDILRIMLDPPVIGVMLQKFS